MTEIKIQKDNLIITLHSDLHLEKLPHSVQFPDVVRQNQADVLILAGDICPIHWYWDLDHNILREEVQSNRNDRQYLFQLWLRRQAKRVQRVYIIKGNHEYYGHSINASIGYPKWLPKNVVVLEDGGKLYDDFDGVRFVGNTLWTDFNGGNPIYKVAVQRGLADYRCITNDSGTLVTAEDIYQLHLKQRKAIIDTVNESPLPCVIITHHSPYFYSEVRQYDALSCGFHCTGLMKELSVPPFAWLYGHTHESTGYWMDIDIAKHPHVGSSMKFQVMSNQLGYPKENTGYNPDFLIEYRYEQGWNLNPEDIAIMRERIPVLAQIKAVAQTMRKAIFEPINIPTDGACLHAAVILQQALEKFVPEIEFVVCGGSPDTKDERYGGEQGLLGRDNEYHGHYWVGFDLLGDRYVCDITSDQFGYEEVVLEPTGYPDCRYREGNRKEIQEHVQEVIQELKIA